MFEVRPFPGKLLKWWYDERASIDMDPVYQRRGGLWTLRDRAFLVDSIINGFDIPKIYIADFTYVNTDLNTKNKPYAVIDGKQRFSAIFDFFDGKLILDKDFKYFKNPMLRLSGLSYKDLKENYPKIASEFENFPLTVISVITDEEARINDLFVRLNRSKPLTGAELRNAMPGVVPALIRELASHEFFKSRISFKQDRGQDLNAAAKILLTECRGRFVGTTKPILDRWVDDGREPANATRFEAAASTSAEILNLMLEVFTERDTLLRTQGPLTVYYWFIRNIDENLIGRVREFLMNFESSRRRNRELVKKRPSDEDTETDDELLNYDILNRSTDNLGTLEGRYKILMARFSRFLSIMPMQF